MGANKGGRNDVVAVTGGSRGIGAEVVREVARKGLDVAIIFRSDETAATRLAGEVGAMGVKALPVRADVGSEPDVVEAFAKIGSFGRLVGLVNNAGISGGRIPIDQLKADGLTELFRVNAIGPILCTREAAGQMAVSKGGKGGAIVNVSSTAANTGGRGSLSHYAASKGAVDLFTVGSAKELAPEGIRVFSIRPSLVLTDLTADVQHNEEWLEAVRKTVPVGRIATPSEIAKPIVRLLDEDMAYLSGSRIDASGGGLNY